MAKVQLTTDSGNYTLYFGMTSVGIWQQKSAQEVTKLQTEDAKKLGVEVDELPDDHEVVPDPMRSLAFLVFAGLCNAADLKEDGVRPSFEDAYLLSDTLNHDQQNEIWKAFSESRAGADLISKLPKGEKKSKAKTNSPQVTK